MKKKILILAGGYSKEREISFKSGKAVFKCLKKKYNLKIFDPINNLLDELKNFNPHVVFNALHGRFGEDGYIQSILEAEKIKYTHSGVISSSLSIDKYLSKKIFRENNILTPKSIKISPQNYSTQKLKALISKNFGFPIVIKPLNEGSSVGVFICSKRNFIENLKKIRPFGEILIEKYIPGREIQSAILGNKILGAIELIPKRKFYDYEAKYNKKAKTKHIMPANISKKNYSNVNKIALKAHRLLGCRGVTRCDFRFYKNKFYLLELNTQPGLTSLSLVPEIAKYRGINFLNLLEWLIKDASIKK